MIKETTSNWIFDEVKNTVEFNLENQKELIRLLVIDKYEYGRVCIAQFVAQTSNQGHVSEDVAKYYNKFDSELQDKIIEFKGTPKQRLSFADNLSKL